MAQRGACTFVPPVVAGTAWYEASALLRLARQPAPQHPDDSDQDDLDDPDDSDDCSPELMRLSRALPQLNLAVGLRNTTYDEVQYFDLLRACRIAFAQRADALELAQRRRDAARMRLEAHTLASSLAGIGAETLRIHAAELEMAIYDGLALQVRIQTPAFLGELREFIGLLERFFAPPAAPKRIDAPDWSGHPALWHQTALALREKVAQYDYAGALSLLQTLEWAHAPEDAPWLQSMRAAIEAFDYDALLGLLRGLAREA